MYIIKTLNDVCTSCQCIIYRVIELLRVLFGAFVCCFLGDFVEKADGLRLVMCLYILQVTRSSIFGAGVFLLVDLKNNN